MKCKNCMAQLEEEALFCAECGTPVENDIKVEEEATAAKVEGDEPQYDPGEKQPQDEFCSNCGNKIDNQSVFCQFCGSKVDDSQENTSEIIPQTSPEVKRKFKRPLILGGVAVAVIIAGIFLAPRITGGLGGGSKSNIPQELFYSKDGGIYGVSLKNSKQKPVEYTDDFADTYSMDAVMDEYSSGYQLISKDQKYRFIIENVEMNSGLSGSTYTLLYSIGNKKPVKIDSNIEGSYHVTDDNKVVYKKNANLYVSDLKEKTKIASDVVRFYLDEDSKNILWLKNNEGEYGIYDIYYQDLAMKKDKIKIDSNSNIIRMSSDLNVLMLMKDESVYLVKNQVDKEKLAGDVDEVYSVDLHNNSFFFTTRVDSSVNAIDFVEDDMAVADSKITEPVRSDYQREESTGSGFFAYTRTITDDKYYEAESLYKSKVDRDKLRSELSQMDIESSYLELYCYSKGEKTLVTSDFDQTLSYVYISEKDRDINKDFTSHMLYAKTNRSEMKKLKLSEIRYAKEVRSLYNNLEDGSIINCLYANGVEVELNLEDEKIKRTYSDPKNNQIYCLILEDGADYEADGKVISISLGASNLGEIVERDSDVGSLETVSNGNLYYLKDINSNGIGDLYSNGKLLLSDVSQYTVNRVPDSDAVVCMTNPNKDKDRGTLVRLLGTKEDVLADDVNFYHAFGESSIVMITEYNYKRSKGDLKYYNGKETYNIDTDVHGFFYTY